MTATALYKSFIDEKLSQPSPTGSNRQDIEALFKQGRVGAIISGPWLRGQLASEAPKLKYGIASVPAGTREATWAGSDSIMLFKSSANKQAAWQFIQDGVFSTETMLDFTLREGFLPALKEEMKDKRLADDASLKAFTDMLPVAKFAPLMPAWNQIVDTTISALQQVYLGQAQPKPALDAAAAKIYGLLSAQ